jgi:hypothetical protein
MFLLITREDRMRIRKALIPFSLILAAGCAAPPPADTAIDALSAKSTSTTAAVILPTGTPSAAPADPATMTPSAEPKVLLVIDDFEAEETAWTVCVDPECADSSAFSVELTPDHATHGIRALKLNFEKNEKLKAVFYIEKPMDLSGGRTVRFDMYHEGTIDGVGFALTTGANAVWHESDAVPVEQGMKVTLSFDITAGYFKTAATNWEFRSYLADVDNVVRLSIVLYPRETGSVLIDYLYLSDAP